jgi:hypothetical protein
MPPPALSDGLSPSLCCSISNSLPHAHPLSTPTRAPGTTRFCVNVTDGAVYAEVCGTIYRPPRLWARNDYYASPAYNSNRTVVVSEDILENDGPSILGGAITVNNITRDVAPSDGVLTEVDLAAGTFVFTPTRGFRGNTTFEYGAPD